MNYYERLQRYLPPITLNLIIINLLIWLAEIVFKRMGFSLTNAFGMHFVGADQFHIYQIFTYCFLHDDSSFTHVFFNMFSLFMFGAPVERHLGKWRYLFFYMICAVFAGITQQLFWAYDIREILSSGAEIITYPGGQMMVDTFLNRLLTVGASGSVFGLLLAFGFLFPETPIYIMFIPIPIRAKYFVVLYGLLELGMGIAGTNDGIAHFAHLGGMLGAIIVLFYWKKKYKMSR